MFTAKNLVNLQTKFDLITGKKKKTNKVPPRNANADTNSKDKETNEKNIIKDIKKDKKTKQNKKSKKGN